MEVGGGRGPGGKWTYMCASLLGTMSLSEPTRARPVARMRRSPFAVRGCSVVPVCRPLSDHSVSPWRTMKTRGVDIVVDRAVFRALNAEKRMRRCCGGVRVGENVEDSGYVVQLRLEEGSGGCGSSRLR